MMPLELQVSDATLWSVTLRLSIVLLEESFKLLEALCIMFMVQASLAIASYKL